ncbi:MAG TPA: hypothetical protein PKA90_10320 [Ignavibacteria bacterium]|nr:hypothetical protein [Ignavibacteria bacterium]HMR40812.1 hypothetical protein [Ignavibacteria bacterium]
MKQIDYKGYLEYFNPEIHATVCVPQKFDLSQNYSDPFNPVTSIKFETPFDGIVILKISDINGKEISTLTDEYRTAGYYEMKLNLILPI